MQRIPILDNMLSSQLCHLTHHVCDKNRSGDKGIGMKIIMQRFRCVIRRVYVFGSPDAVIALLIRGSLGPTFLQSQDWFVGSDRRKKRLSVSEAQKIIGMKNPRIRRRGFIATPRQSILVIHAS